MKIDLVWYVLLPSVLSILCSGLLTGKSVPSTQLREPKFIKISDSLAVKVDDEEGMFTWDSAIENCASYGEGWHAPSMIELSILYKQKDKIGGFKGEWYWSSSEFFNDFGRSLNFKTGEQNDDYEDKNHANCVRCVNTIAK